MSLTLATPPSNGNVTVSCLVCGAALPTGRQSRRYCSESCRQAAWRRRHATSLEPPSLPEKQLRRPASVYICPDCGARYLGEQYCQECHTFCQGAGVGGFCPCCDEPVAYQELTR